MAFTSLNHHLDLVWLLEAYQRTRAVHRDVQERDGPAKDRRQHRGVVEALGGPAFARAAPPREVQDAAVV
jgi:hypothetical protein